MKPILNEVRRRRRTVVDAAVAFLVILLIVQMWLLTATLEAYLAGHTGVALPGAAVSLFLFLGCFGLYRFVERIFRTSWRITRGRSPTSGSHDERLNGESFAGPTNW